MKKYELCCVEHIMLDKVVILRKMDIYREVFDDIDYMLVTVLTPYEMAVVKELPKG